MIGRFAKKSGGTQTINPEGLTWLSPPLTSQRAGVVSDVLAPKSTLTVNNPIFKSISQSGTRFLVKDMWALAKSAKPWSVCYYIR